MDVVQLGHRLQMGWVLEDLDLILLIWSVPCHHLLEVLLCNETGLAPGVYNEDAPREMMIGWGAEISAGGGGRER
jgi:hypothetical protein